MLVLCYCLANDTSYFNKTTRCNCCHSICFDGFCLEIKRTVTRRKLNTMLSVARSKVYSRSIPILHYVCFHCAAIIQHIVCGAHADFCHCWTASKLLKCFQEIQMSNWHIQFELSLAMTNILVWIVRSVIGMIQFTFYQLEIFKGIELCKSNWP